MPRAEIQTRIEPRRIDRPFEGLPMSNGSKGEWARATVAPVLVALIIAAAGAMITWGTLQTRVEQIEVAAKEDREDGKTREKRLAQHDTDLAVMHTTLTTMDKKLDRIWDRLKR
jgi:hypothetical protein